MEDGVIMRNTYRIWCENNKEWEKNLTTLLPDGRLIDLDHQIPVKNETHKVYYSLGILDDNNKLIYEGDIIKRTETFPIAAIYGKTEIGVVKYHYGSYYLMCEDLDYLISKDRTSLCKPHYEIIGNECENKELISDIFKENTEDKSDKIIFDM